MADLSPGACLPLLQRFGIELHRVRDDQPIPASFWGAPEAGIKGTDVFVRSDTPVHSLLHEMSHIICMTPARRLSLDRDAGGCDPEESAVCYLQLLLADDIAGVGQARIMRDMDRWGYSFRLGSTALWFKEDADDAREWLLRHRLISCEGKPSYHMRCS